MKKRDPRFVLSLATLPAAALASGCTMRAWTPSASVAYYGEYAPEPHVVAVPSQPDLIAKWQLSPSNPWARYEKMTLVSALDAQPRHAPLPDITQLDVVRRAAAAGSHVAAAGLANDTMWIVDLRGAASVAFGAMVSRGAREPVSLVPTFNNWPADNELVPAEEALAAMITFAPRLPDPSAPGTRPVFMLDAWRLAYSDLEVDEDVTDNRYLIYPSDLPDVVTLGNNGIRRIVYVVESLDEATQEEDDLHAIFDAYQAAGIRIYMIDLSALITSIEPGRWDDEVWPRYRLIIEPRVTVVDDPLFYRRARGGFGGIHGGPSPLRDGPHWGGGGFGGGFGGG